MASLGKKAWTSGILALVLVAVAAMPAVAAPVDTMGGETGLTSLWQVLADGWNSLLAAVGVDGGDTDPSEPLTSPTDDGTTQTSTPPGGGGDMLGPMDPDG